MKKYFLLVVLMMVVFLWLGSDASAAVTCDDWRTQCASASLCDCIEDTDLSGNSYSPPIYMCECKDSPSSATTAKDNCEIRWDSWISDGAWNMWCCYSDCVACMKTPWYVLKFDATAYRIDCFDSGDQALVSSLPCTLSSSKYYNDPNSTSSDLNITCKCKTGYGDYPWNTTPNICQPCSDPDVCCGVKLNTNVPFIGNCLEQDTSDPSAVSPERAFPVLMSSLTKILVTVILIVSFVLIVVWGIMIASAWANQSRASEWRKLIMKVVVGIALLGASGVILRLINPNFFG